VSPGVVVPGIRKWPRRLTRAVLAAHGVVNDWDLLRSGEPAVAWQTSDRRSPIPRGWHLWRKNAPIPGTAWYERGGQTFPPFLRIDRAAALLLAMARAEELCGGRVEWTRTPWQSYVPVAALERVQFKIRQGVAP
jgi:hypothetical protein